MRAVLYARFSPRPNASTCPSNETQLDLCRAYCKGQGWEVAACHQDDAMSGGNLQRDGLWAAIDDLKRGYVLVVNYLDRLARHVAESIDIEQEVEKRGARIVSVAGEGTWSDSADDRLVRTICRAIAEYQREKQAERTSAAMKRHQGNGRRMSDRIPFGFKAGETEDLIVPDPDEQAIIPRILELHAQGMGLRAIGRTLTESGIHCRGNGWHHSTIKNIIDRAKA